VLVIAATEPRSGMNALHLAIARNNYEIAF
jgi:hypothetical protein